MKEELLGRVFEELAIKGLIFSEFYIRKWCQKRMQFKNKRQDLFANKSERVGSFEKFGGMKKIYMNCIFFSLFPVDKLIPEPDYDLQDDENEKYLLEEKKKYWIIL